jgi:predicted type IV restriction endonuclease
MSRNHSRQKIEELVRIFAKEHTDKLNEAETRLRFIDPFFEALGWNIRNPNARRTKHLSRLQRLVDV